MKVDPNFTLLPRDLNPRFYDVLRWCLAKDRKERLHSIGDVRIELEQLAPVLRTTPGVAVPQLASAWTTKLLAATTVLAIAVALAAVVTAWKATSAKAPIMPIRFPFVLPDGQRLTRTNRPNVAISPSGDRIVYVADNQLYMRLLSETDAHPVVGSATDASVPFFSHDGQWIGFYSVRDNQLKKVAVTGGAAVTVSDQIPGPYGASWGSGGQIIVASPTGVFGLPATGGRVQELFKPDQGQITSAPRFLPDGDHFLFAAGPVTGDRWGSKAQVFVQSLKSGERRVVLNGGSDATYVPTGHLVYALGGTLFAIRFDVSKLTIIGGPVPVVENILSPVASVAGNANYAIADNGTIVYLLPTQYAAGQSKLAFVDAHGSKKLLPPPEGRYFDPRISPDGKQIAVALQTSDDSSIWIYDVSGTTSMRRLTFEGSNSRPQWTRDGRRVIFTSIRGEDTSLFWQNADGSGVAERLTTPEKGIDQAPNSVSPDGKALAFFKSVSGGDVWVVSLAEDRTAKSLISAPVTHEDHSSFSPMGNGSHTAE
jgi:serine/threonine-protein kinase